MSRQALTGLRLVGEPADLALALDRLHLLADVAGVAEREGEVEVWLRGAPPELPATVSVQRLAVPAPATGLEADRAISIEADLLVRPPWVPSAPGFHGVQLVVPRGGAFGSGEHASTQAALRALHALWDGPASFADVGTGSGILALYARQRGCPRVLACDVDPAAVRAARALLPGAEVTIGGPESLPAAADLTAANLSFRELDAALDPILAKWTGRSSLVLSGLRENEWRGLAARLPRAPDLVLAVGDFRAVALQPHR